MAEIVPEKNISQSIRIKAPVSHVSFDSEHTVWGEALDAVIQKTYRILQENKKDETINFESFYFIRNLFLHFKEQTQKNISVNKMRTSSRDVHSIFSKLKATFTFRLRDRNYARDSIIESSVEGQKASESEIQVVLHTAHAMSHMYDSDSVKLKDEPTTEELLSILFDHLNESIAEFSDQNQKDQPVKWGKIKALNSAHRGLIRVWQQRLEAWYRRDYSHSHNESDFFSYPFVDAVLPDGKTILLIIVSPLDMNFVDEKVDEDQRLAEISLAMFEVDNAAACFSLQSAVPLLKQAFARILYTNMLQESNQALAETFTEQSNITKYWMKIGAGGLRNFLEGDKANKVFDPWHFCEAIIKKVLCAKIPGVNKLEVYPFDRAIVFKEAGTSSDIKNEPIEVRIFEAAVLSKKPGDRGQNLTRQERKYRGTISSDCDPSNKQINDDDISRLFIHGDGDNLYLSWQKTNNKNYDQSNQSYKENKHEKKNYPIGKLGVPEDETSIVAKCIYNLLGRLSKEALNEIKIRRPGNKNETFAITTTFSDEFMKLRNELLLRADESGFIFEYDHGVYFQEDVPVIQNFLNAYNSFLDDKFEEKNNKFLEIKYKQLNLKEQQIKEIMEYEKKSRKIETNSIRFGAERTSEQIKSKLVFISFSPDIHDANQKRLISIENEDGSEQKNQSLLGDEFAFTMVLVSDVDPPKSVARLQAEKEDLKAFFQVLLNQIWQDRVNEYEYLRKKSDSIGKSLEQFFHHMKTKLNADSQNEIDDFLKRLKEFIRPTSRNEQKPFDTLDDLLKTLLIVKENENWGNVFHKNVQNILEKLSTGKNPLPPQLMSSWQNHIKVTRNPIPPLKVDWSDGIIQDVFKGVLKNAIEAAVYKADPYVDVRFEVTPENLRDENSRWYLDVLVENSGGPIPKGTLDCLNQIDPVYISKNASKEGSTGIGIYLSRFQLINVIGGGSDLKIINLPDGKVQTRIRLPAELIISAENEIVNKETRVDFLQHDETPYLLYVEDNKAFYEQGIKKLHEFAEQHGIRVVHARSLLGAKKFIELNLPLVLITDLTIPTNENSRKEIPDNGKKLLKVLVENTKGSKMRPPIWLLTATNETDIWDDDLCNAFNEHGYQKLTFNEDQAIACSQEGIACQLHHQGRTLKAPEEVSALKIMIDEIAARAGLNTNPGTSFQVRFQHKDFSDSISLQKGLNSYLKEGIPDGEFLLLKRAVGPNENLQKVFEPWFENEGLPDNDWINEPNGGRCYALNDSGQHKNLLMLMALSSEMFTKIRPDIIYWGIQNNILITSEETRLENIVNDWTRLTKEERGPLSRLRHDIRSLSSKLLPARLDNVLNWIAQCDDALFLDKDLLDWLKGVSVMTDIPGKQKIYCDDTSEIRKHLRDKLDALYQSLIHQSREDDSIANELIDFRWRVGILRRFLEVAI